MSQITEEKRATAVVDLAKQMLPVIAHVMGPIPATASQPEVVKYYNTLCDASFSLAGMFRRKSIELVSQAKAIDDKQGDAS